MRALLDAVAFAARSVSFAAFALCSAAACCLAILST
jgi:hypothetical protein